MHSNSIVYIGSTVGETALYIPFSVSLPKVAV